MRKNLVLLVRGATLGLLLAACETHDGAALPRAELGYQRDAGPPDFGFLVDHSSPDHAFLRETVTCRFDNTSELASCQSDRGSCEGVSSCPVAVLGGIDGFEKPTWHSSCGGEVSTATDGVDESVVFDCALTQPTTETVTCRFVGSAAAQTCSSPAGQCTGALSCSVQVTANQGAQLRWTSACAGYARSSDATIVDGADDEVVFACGGATVSETITCDFRGSSKEQNCSAAGWSSTPTGPGQCSGIGSCSTVLEGPVGTAVQWKASCDPASGEIYGFSLLDGQDETVAWSCAP